MPLQAAATAKTPGPMLTPEMFGARGDGKTDDSAAFAALSARINAAGGGTVMLRATTYIVARRGGDFKSWSVPADLLAFRGCTRPLVIRGNGARLRCADGQRFGRFTPNGEPYTTAGKRPPGTKAATPYFQMILVQDCSGDIEISDLELDGNLDAHVVGGHQGDKGWQIRASGLTLQNNSGAETVRNIHAHHHALDGFYIDGVDADTKPRRQLISLKAEDNGRQGMSIVGGRGYEISRSVFARTGRAALHSAPAAGVDIEAERGKKIRDLHFIDCRFVDNSGCGLVADTGDSADVRFDGCTFIGTTNWAAWPNKPGFGFANCLFLGSIVRVFGDPNPARAVQFLDCTFRDDPKLSPTGSLMLRNNLIADIPQAQNVLFERCAFLLDHDGVLPWSRGPIWSNCTMRQRSPQVARTRGIFRGTNRITGRVSIGGSTIEGTLVLNGKTLPHRPHRPI